LELQLEPLDLELQLLPDRELQLEPPSSECLWLLECVELVLELELELRLAPAEGIEV
jgi:hypothetical protein